jgi:O-methyltransferase
MLPKRLLSKAEDGLLTIKRADRMDAEKWLEQNSDSNWHYRREEAFERIYMNRQPPHEVGNNDLPALYDVALSVIGQREILYLEFGVADGRSMRRIIDRFTHPDSRFVGFDSFQGLPEDWVQPHGIMPRGTFSREQIPPAISDQRLSFEKGWFQNTLHPFINKSNKSETNGVVLVHFDADLYSSTLYILGTLYDRYPEYYFIFDEFMSHEIVALHDFSLAFPVELEFICQTNAGGYPNQVFGKIKRTEFVVQ